MPQSTQTTRVLPLIPVSLNSVAQAISIGDMPNPSYLYWAATAMCRVSWDGGAHVEVQVCGDLTAQSPDACYPYICNWRFDGDALIIDKVLTCLDESDVESVLLSNNFDDVTLVDNSEDWFPRLQYYFDY